MYELSLGKHDFPWMSLTIVELTLCLLDDLFCFLSYTVCTWIAKYVLMMFQKQIAGDERDSFETDWFCICIMALLDISHSGRQNRFWHRYVKQALLHDIGRTFPLNCIVVCDKKQYVL